MGTLRKLLRRTFYTAAALSTLLLTLILWPVSYDRIMSAEYSCEPQFAMGTGIQCGRVVAGYGNPFAEHDGTVRFNMVHPISGITSFGGAI